MYQVETKSRCLKYLAKLRAEGYTVWQTQYGTYSPEGYHVQFWKSGQPIIELYTHNPEVEKEMQKYTAK
jgi:hypothetical protein